MKITENELENRLRQAPAPQPPAALRKQLIENITLSPNGTNNGTGKLPASNWLAFWKPAMALAAIMVACIATLAVQQIKIRDLRQSIVTLEEQSNAAKQTQTTMNKETSSHSSAGASLTSSRAELTELPQTIEKLKAEIKVLEGLRAENAKLRTQLSAYSGLTEEENKVLQQAKDRAERIKCVNNLKNMGLAVRVFATDNGDVFPPDILSMSNELSTPKILICPADTQRAAAANWQEYGPANMSYEYLAPSANSIEPNRVMFRCPIHNNICLADGSVQQAENMANKIIQIDGKTYFGDSMESAKIGSTPSAPATVMSEAMRKRYGLPPASVPADTSKQNAQ
jgi:hypothetical protein